MNEPSISFKDGKMWFNTACLKKFPDTDYVRFAVDDVHKRLLAEPSTEEKSNDGRWCGYNPHRRSVKAIPCGEFFLRIVNLMGWDSKCRYKIIGRFACNSIEFDLNKAITEEKSNEKL
jgi:hypothetical protein